MYWGGFSPRGTGQLIAKKEILKSEDDIKILDENLALFVQNLDLGGRFIFQEDGYLKIR